MALRRGNDPRAKKVTVPTIAKALERYLDGRPDLSSQTANWYRQKVDGPLKPLCKLPSDRIDCEVVQSLHERLTKQSGPYCANGAMRVLKLFLNDISRTHDLPPNPVTRGVRINKEQARDWAVGPDEIPLLWRRLDAMEDRMRRVCWRLMLTTGLRIGFNNSETLECVKAVVPDAKTTPKCIAWLRKELRAAGEAIPTSREIYARRKNDSLDTQEEQFMRLSSIHERTDLCEPHEVKRKYFHICKRKFGFSEASKMAEALGRSAFWLADQKPNRWA